MAGNVPSLSGRHGVDGTAPKYERAWTPESLRTATVEELCRLLEEEIGAIISRCHNSFCGSSALKIRTNWNEDSRRFVVDLIFCSNCSAAYFSPALRELVPIIKEMMWRTKSGISFEEEERLISVWFRQMF